MPPEADEQGFDALVDYFLPYISGSTKISGQSTDAVLEFRSRLSRFRSMYRDIKFRGPSFDKLRRVAATDPRNIHNDPRDSISVKLLARMTMGKKDSDEAVEDFLKPILAQLDELARFALMQSALSDQSHFLSDPANALMIMDFIATRVFGGTTIVELNEAVFQERYKLYQSAVVQNISNPTMVGSLMVAKGLGSLRDAEKAQKRNQKGRYDNFDLRILSDYLREECGPCSEIAARFQRKMGWSVSSWDPISALESIKHGRR
jgi:hypothetical protein